MKDADRFIDVTVRVPMAGGEVVLEAKGPARSVFETLEQVLPGAFRPSYAQVGELVAFDCRYLAPKAIGERIAEYVAGRPEKRAFTVHLSNTGTAP